MKDQCDSALVHNWDGVTTSSRGRKLIVEVTYRVLVTRPITSGKVWDKSQSLPLQGITWSGERVNRNVGMSSGHSRRSEADCKLSAVSWMRPSQAWNRSRLADEFDVWGGVQLQNPIQTTLHPLFLFWLFWSNKCLLMPIPKRLLQKKQKKKNSFCLFWLSRSLPTQWSIYDPWIYRREPPTLINKVFLQYYPDDVLHPLNVSADVWVCIMDQSGNLSPYRVYAKHRHLVVHYGFIKS